MAITLKGNAKINNNINSTVSACESIIRGVAQHIKLLQLED